MYHYEKSVNAVSSKAEDIFVQLFCEAFGPEKEEKLYVQYPFKDIYGNQRYIDFALENEDMRIAIEIDGETYHNPKLVSENKYYDDLLKQNSLVHNEWKVFRWAYRQLMKQPEKVKDELLTFLGENPFFKAFEDYLPLQQGKVIELREYQEEAIENLQNMRAKGESIALLYHATGIGKTVTAATDAKSVGGRTLFLVNALKLADQAEDTFANIWPEASRGRYTGSVKSKTEQVIFATIQSISRNLDDFFPDSFDYIIIDECHHAAAKTYKKLLNYFKLKFILGLSATPERMDGENMLELFQNTAHKMDLKTAVENGYLAPIRCIRVKTNVDLSDVRINGIKYNMQDLESKIYVPERNKLIVDTYLKYVKNKKTVIFCASVKHAQEIAELLQTAGVKARPISGQDKLNYRNSILEEYENGNVNVLCACDLLNEGWDSPRTEVLFMARPTMSKTIYLQQVGRGTRKCEGKEDLLVFDFVDNARMLNTPCSLHRILNIAEYRPFEYVVAPPDKKQFDKNMVYQGEKPTMYLDIPIDAKDFEVIDLFDWQNEAKNMLSQTEFVRMVDVQEGTIESYIKNGKIKPDLSVPISDTRRFNYFHKESIEKYAKEFNWDLITSANIKEKFIEYINTMDMSYSYKPVLFMAMLDRCNDTGRVKVQDLIDFFIDYYEGRKDKGLVVEKKASIFAKGDYSRKDVEHLIFRNPFKVVSDMSFVKRCKEIEWIMFNPSVYKKLSSDDKDWIIDRCNKKLEEYYARFEK
ncbi:DNA/RNA helicase [Candidatus Syntrophocurvum alkaliphilum]|uniref:DNA/RNA helicase n=1 Tax=Candidatus Syntrophocurvum alkaliphilum TaxID=2293317 RepID=A0A6I6DHE6_9FIRM|nr:DEAD/DEAH box helicase family protein [Candidatus Syntrophocurvum alkaliphilum]QGT99770.1 DNA/RNA helicase [Candidatus Syntrophocurvum alkaliphilum]